MNLRRAALSLAAGCLHCLVVQGVIPLFRGLFARLAPRRPSLKQFYHHVWTTFRHSLEETLRAHFVRVGNGHDRKRDLVKDGVRRFGQRAKKARGRIDVSRQSDADRSG